MGELPIGRSHSYFCVAKEYRPPILSDFLLVMTMFRLTLCSASMLVGGLTFLGVAVPAQATLSIQVNYSGPASFQPFFTDAASTWESLLVGYQDGSIQAVSSGSSYLGDPVGTPLTTVFIDAALAPNDGVGGVLGFAGPTEIALDGASFILTTDGIMSFDDADAGNLVTNGLFGDVVMHEMGHVLGFGTLWTNNGVYTSGTGEFTGANATAAWQSEFGQAGTPDVEQDGGAGTADGHWNENNGGAGLTGITDGLARDMRDELMTGWLNGNSFISEMTIGSFIDIGFTGVTAVPEFSAFASGSLISMVFFFRRSKKD